VLTKEVWERAQKTSHFTVEDLQTQFKAKHEKGMGTPFPPHYTPSYTAQVMLVWETWSIKKS